MNQESRLFCVFCDIFRTVDGRVDLGGWFFATISFMTVQDKEKN